MSKEFSGNQELRATGQQLSAHIDALTDVELAQLPQHKITVDMGRLLADRFANNIRGVTPRGYWLATEMLKADCTTGFDSMTEEPMPDNLTELHPALVQAFSFTAVSLARGAFGDEFADEVQATADAYQADMAGGEEPSAP